MAAGSDDKDEIWRVKQEMRRGNEVVNRTRLINHQRKEAPETSEASEAAACWLLQRGDGGE